MALADDIAGEFLSGKGKGPIEPDADDAAPAGESPGQMLIAAVKAGDAQGVEAAVRACMETTSY